LLDNIKELYRIAGPMGKSVSFIVIDSQIKSESFLESINSMLATSDISGMIPIIGSKPNKKKTEFYNEKRQICPINKNVRVGITSRLKKILTSL